MIPDPYLAFEPVLDWEHSPDGLSHRDVADVAINSADDVYLLTRYEPGVVVYDRAGHFVRAWGRDVLTSRPHGITIGPDDSVYVVDEKGHSVRRFTAEGSQLASFGVSGVASDTGFDPHAFSKDATLRERVAAIRGGPPFNRPTAAAIAPNGDVYVADGYGNARVHRFSASGELEHSWGEPGTGPGQFHLVHHVALDLVHGRVVVCDRENDRIQVFSLDGNYITEWRDVHRPAAATITSDGLAIVAEIGWVVGDYSWMHGDITRRKPSRVSILDADSGKVLRRFGVGEYPEASVAFTCAHGVASNSHGDLFIAETPYSWARLAGGRQDEPAIEPECPTIQVLARVRPV